MGSFTFGIITNNNRDFANKVIDSIESQNIPESQHEIIVVGGEVNRENTTCVLFDEHSRPNWITRKKNIVAELAEFENIALSHDYVAYMPDWYKNFEEFGYDWDVCMNRIEDINGHRFRDWMYYCPSYIKHLPYDVTNLTKDMYISGTYYCVKKDFALKNPLDEERSWGESEDVEWSLRLRDRWNYKMNPKSIVRFLKPKDHYPPSPDWQ
jgi:hypothetical protein